MINQSLIGKIPKVDQVLADPLLQTLLVEIPRVLIVKSIRLVMEHLRFRFLENKVIRPDEITLTAIVKASYIQARRLARPSLRRVINGTGVIIHTNLGRSLLAKSVLRRIFDLNRNYTNLEYDLKVGVRGNRYSHVIGLLKEITGAEAALVVNNNAAAIYICLQSLAQGREVIISRGQLVEIGDFFRISDIIINSGAILREVGATNKVHFYDYESAINSKTAIILKVHTSNFSVVGFHEEVSRKILCTLTNRYQLIFIEDLGSGVVINLSKFNLSGEPTVQEILFNGVDIVTFSGDKLLGGPQAGIILGRINLIKKIYNNPLIRVIRIDKLSLVALEATLELYREPQKAIFEIPTLRMLTVSYNDLRKRALRLMRGINKLRLARIRVKIRDGISRVGGGALPLAALATCLIEIEIKDMSSIALERALRLSPIAIIARLERDGLVIDPRTLLEEDLEIIIDTLRYISKY